MTCCAKQRAVASKLSNEYSRGWRTSNWEIEFDLGNACALAPEGKLPSTISSIILMNFLSFSL